LWGLTWTMQPKNFEISVFILLTKKKYHTFFVMDCKIVYRDLFEPWHTRLEGTNGV
jgi:hypothetical protein